jgi:hypothetical protein
LAQSLVRVGGEFQVNAHTFQNQDQPAVDADHNGTAAVVWVEHVVRPSGVGNRIVARRYDHNGSAEGTEFEIASFFSGANPSKPDVALDGAGGFIVTWVVSGRPPFGVFAKRFDATGEVMGTEFFVNTYTRYGTYFGTPAIAGDGRQFIVTWSRSGYPGYTEVFARRLNELGLPVGDEFQVNTHTPRGQGGANAAFGADGEFAIVWSSSDQDGSGAGVFGRRFDAAGQALTHEFQVNSYTSGDQSVPRAAVDPHGNLIVVWTSSGQDGSSGGVFGQRFAAAAGRLGVEFQVNSSTVLSQYHGDLDIAADGTALVVWESFRPSSGGDVSARFYASSGVELGGEFVINSYVESTQFFPAVASARDREFVVVWSSFNQDGSLFGIFGQRLEAGGGTIAPPEIPTTSATGLVAMIALLGSAACWIASVDRRG